MNKFLFWFIIIEVIFSNIYSYKNEYDKAIHSLCFVIVAILLDIYLKLI